MKIISGIFRGHPLISPKGDAVRPSSEQLRGALFNICQNNIKDSSFLDLFAGSGAIGLEALSRGAKSATFVEQDPAALQCIRKNIEKLGVEKQCSILSMDVVLALKRLKEPFDIIFLDPPYKLSFQECTRLLHMIDSSLLLKPSGLLFLEKAPTKGEKEEEPTFIHLHLKNARHFGNTILRQYTETI